MDLESPEFESEFTDSEIAFWTSVLEPHNLQAREDLMSEVEYTPVVNHWWRNIFIGKFRVNDQHMNYDDWKGLYKFTQATDLPDTIRKAKSSDVKYLNILGRLNLLSKPDTSLLVEDADYTLLQACKTNNHNLVKFLVTTKAVVNAQVLLQGLYWGCVNKNKRTVETLLANVIIDQQADNYSSLFETVRQDSLKILKLLISWGANIKAQGFLALKLAISLKNIEIFEYLLDFIDHADVDFDNGYLIRLACKKGNIEAVEILSIKGADMDIGKGEPIYIAAVNGYMNIVKDLVEIYGADPKLPRVLQAVYAVASQKNSKRSTELLKIIS